MYGKLNNEILTKCLQLESALKEHAKCTYRAKRSKNLKIEEKMLVMNHHKMLDFWLEDQNGGKLG